MRTALVPVLVAVLASGPIDADGWIPDATAVWYAW